MLSNSNQVEENGQMLSVL